MLQQAGRPPNGLLRPNARRLLYAAAHGCRGVQAWAIRFAISPPTGFSAGCLRSASPPRAGSVRQLPAARTGFAGPGPGREIVGAGAWWSLNFLHLQTHTHVDQLVSPGGPFHLTRSRPVTQEFRSSIAARSSLRTHLSMQNFKFHAW